MLEAGDLTEEAVVATGGLGAALDYVAGDDGAGQRVPVVPCPLVPPRRRPHHEGGVGDPAGDDHVGARGEPGGDAAAPQVGVGGEDLGVQRLTGVEVDEGMVQIGSEAMKER